MRNFGTHFATKYWSIWVKQFICECFNHQICTTNWSEQITMVWYTLILACEYIAITWSRSVFVKLGFHVAWVNASLSALISIQSNHMHSHNLFHTKILKSIWNLSCVLPSYNMSLTHWLYFMFCVVQLYQLLAWRKTNQHYYEMFQTWLQHFKSKSNVSYQI